MTVPNPTFFLMEMNNKQDCPCLYHPIWVFSTEGYCDLGKRIAKTFFPKRGIFLLNTSLFKGSGKISVFGLEGLSR